MRDADAVLEDWYVGEMGGEALFWGLAERAEPDQARKWLALAEIESLLARRLAAILLARDRPIPECLDASAKASVRWDAVAGKTWPEQMRWLREIAAAALSQMQIDAAHLPVSLGATCELVLAHEIALMDFAQAEIDGRAQDSLRPVRELLSRC